MWFVIIALLVAAVVVWAIVSRKTTPAQPNKEAVMAKMNVEPSSSYEQKTNHFPMTEVDMGPLSGSESPYRVNLYQAHMV